MSEWVECEGAGQTPISVVSRPDKNMRTQSMGTCPVCGANRRVKSMSLKRAVMGAHSRRVLHPR